MHPRRLGVLAGALFVLALAGPCRAAPDLPTTALLRSDSMAAVPDTSARFAIHDGFDRLVIPLATSNVVATRQDGAVLTVRAAAMGQVKLSGRLGHRLLAVDWAPGSAVLHLMPGAHARIWRMEDRLVIDVREALPPAQPAGSAAPGQVAAATSARVAAATSAPMISPSPAKASVQEPAHSGGSAQAGHGKASPHGTAPTADVVLHYPPRGQDSEARTGGLPGHEERAERGGLVTTTPLSSAAPASSPGPDTPPALRDAASPSGVGAAVSLLPRDSGLGGPAMLLPLGREVGAAAFPRLGEAHAIFDVAQPLDLSALQDDPVFGTVREQLLPDGMHLRFRLGTSQQLRLVRRDDGWVVVVLESSAGVAVPSQIVGHVDKGVLALDLDTPGRVVTLDDETTGGRLLVGTQRTVGQRLTGVRRMPEFSLLPTWLGVVVEPVADRLIMRPIRNGFELSTAGKPSLSLVWSDQLAGAWPDGRSMTRVFDLPDLPPPILARRLGQALREAAMAPKTQRFGPRVAVGSAMLAQGLDVEAASVLHAAQADDPAHREDPVAMGLAAIADWLSAKAGGGSAPPPDIDLGKLGQSDEAAFWRALLTPDQPDAAPQAASLATTWPLLLGYPPSLRRLVLKQVAAILRAGGQDKALTAFLQTFPDQSLDVSRALRLQHLGQTDAALSLLERVAARPDRLARATALEEAVGIRLATHRLDEAGAAAALDHQLYAWRDADRELRLRIRIARLRAQAGSWRAALAMLRDTAAQYPQAQVRLRAEQEAVVAELLQGAGAARLSAFDLVTLTDEAADILTATKAQADLAPLLVDKLMALDLPGRAEPILRRLFDQAPPGVRKAELGVRLASLVADRDSAAAIAVLDASPDDGLPDKLVARRRLLRAQVLWRAGDAAGALAALSAQHDADADDLRAGVMEAQRDWAGAAQTLRGMLVGADFGRLPDTAQRDAILRLARDEGEGNDVAGLQLLARTQAARFATGKDAQLFAVLTAPPVRNQDDLPRAAGELAAMRALPGELAHARPF